jgi:hypothetical protein
LLFFLFFFKVKHRVVGVIRKGSVLAISDRRGIEGQLNYKYERGTCNWIDSKGIGKHELVLKETSTFIIPQKQSAKQ